jgi:hypothetical protein
VEDLPQDIGLVYRSLGLRGLESLPGVSPGMARQIELWLSTNSECADESGRSGPI